MIKLGGILGIVGGGLILFWSIIILFISVFAEPIGETKNMDDALFIGIIAFLVGILVIVCGIRALKTNKWRWAISGYILFSSLIAYIIFISIVMTFPHIFQ